jgi:hypothetical protein
VGNRQAGTSVKSLGIGTRGTFRKPGDRTAAIEVELNINIYIG